MKLTLLVLLLTVSFSVISQSSHRKTEHKARLIHKATPSVMEPGFDVGLYHLEAPVPTGISYRSFLMQQKLKVDSLNKLIKTTPKFAAPKSGVEQPVLLKHFEPQRRTINGFSSFNAGIPSDNTLAVSKDDILLVAVNSLVYGYDLQKDTTVLNNQTINLTTLASGTANEMYYDPKLLYDPSLDRFILVFLKDFQPETSEVIVCFSATNDPNEEWYVYSLPGDPLDTYRWTDFPAISVTDDKLYFTANLIIPDVSWQEGFDGSIIWEIDKIKGFDGVDDIDATLYDQIMYDNMFIRNLHPVQGADGIADKQFFLSNRNFDIENDTIFLAQFDEFGLNVDAFRSNVSYGVPPNARQFDTDTTDPTGGLQTNDARVLGAVLLEDNIHFVGNTRNPSTGYSAIYHGIFSDLYHDLSLEASIIGDQTKDFAYPNIAWSGSSLCDHSMIIGFNHSSFNDFPGVSSVYFDDEKGYSNVLTVKEGGNYVNRLPTHYERWGDYFGMQRDYSISGIVHSYGYLALENNRNSGYYAMLASPDTTQLFVDYDIVQQTGVCSFEIRSTPKNGIAPYLYAWNDQDFDDNGTFTNACLGDTVNVTVVDGRGCTFEDTLVIKSNGVNNEGNYAYPNPAHDLISIPFELTEDAIVVAELFDKQGRLVSTLMELPAKKGKNEFTCSLAPLSAGVYTLILKSNQRTITSQQIIKK